ncbi:Vacuolar amino acid transporter 3 [Apiospora arundinis]
MATPDRGRSSPFVPPMASSPGGSFRGRNYGTSLPRADATARLASPVPSGAFGTASQRSGSPAPANDDEVAEDLTPLPGAAQTGQAMAGPGVSALAAALSNSVGTSPPRFGTPPVRSSSPAATGQQVQASATPTNYGSFDARSRYLQGGGTGAYEDPDIIKRHLVQPSDASDAGGFEPTADSIKGKQPGEATEAEFDEDEFSSLRLQGGDITRPIYKWTEEAEGRNRPQRSKSFSVPRPEPETEVLDINTIKVPGGFRRNYLRRAARSPSNSPEDPEIGRSSRKQPQLFTTSFLEFLTIYGHFAGEELEEDDENLLPGEYFASGEEDEYESDEEAMRTTSQWKIALC